MPPGRGSEREKIILKLVSGHQFFFVFLNKDPDKLLHLISGERTEISVFICILLILISMTGLCICIFIINKKINSVYYARSVNGIRKYFIDKSDIKISEYIVLPTVINFPRYFQSSFLCSIIFAFAIINSVFLFFAFWVMGCKYFSFAILVLFIIVHISIYWFWAKLKSKN